MKRDVTYIWGPKGSGKSELAYKLAASERMTDVVLIERAECQKPVKIDDYLSVPHLIVTDVVPPSEEERRFITREIPLEARPWA